MYDPDVPPNPRFKMRHDSSSIQDPELWADAFIECAEQYGYDASPVTFESNRRAQAALREESVKDLSPIPLSLRLIEWNFNFSLTYRTGNGGGCQWGGTRHMVA